MSKLVEFLKNDHIRGASVCGLCIIILAVIFKKVMHMEVPHLENAVPGFVFTLYEAVRKMKPDRFWSKIWFWNTLMLASTALIILRHLV